VTIFSIDTSGCSVSTEIANASSTPSYSGDGGPATAGPPWGFSARA
jgi:hypothetical protein